jgi:NAD(P)-dependent dehydrogenase (short-subunit alcohol dehydrogenase family)
LVNNAGIAPPVNIEEATVEDMRKVMEINLMGPMIGIQLAIKSMKKTGGGSIVTVASNSTSQVTQATGIYSPSKAAVANLTKVVALHCAREKLNIRVNTVHPGPSRTPMLTDQFSDEVLDQISQSSPMGRLAEPIEIGYVVAFLASDEASFVTGAEYFADGAITVAQF